MRLAGPRRPVQQQSTLDVLTSRTQSIGVLGDPNRMRLNRLEFSRCKHDIAALDVWQVDEAEPELTMHPEREGHDLAAKCVVLVHQRTQPSEESVGGCLGRTHDLNEHFLAVVLRGVHQRNHRCAIDIGQHQPRPQTVDGLVDVDVDGDVLTRSLSRPVP